VGRIGKEKELRDDIRDSLEMFGVCGHRKLWDVDTDDVLDDC